MAPRKTNLDQWKHPFNAYPFEAFVCGSWKPVELIKIESGRVTLHFMDNQEMAIEKGFADMRTRSKIATFADVRIRSRKATLSDCTSFLRCGIDVCVLSAFKSSDDPNESNSNPVWFDAKIKSIERKPHNPECLCEYLVSFYTNQGSLGSHKKTLCKDVQVVGLNQISILQRLGCKSLEDQLFRWDSSEDCIDKPPTRLSLGKFVCDISWLATVSLLKNMSFCARSVQNKILYQIMETYTSNSNLNLRVVNFKLNGGITRLSVFVLDNHNNVPTSHKNDVEFQPGGNAIVVGETSSRCNLRSHKKYQRNDLSDSDHMMVVLAPKRKRLSSKREAKGKRRRSSNFLRDINGDDDDDVDDDDDGYHYYYHHDDDHDCDDDHDDDYDDDDEERASRRSALDADAYKKMIDSYFKEMDKLPATKEVPINEQWNEAINFGKDKETNKTQREEEVEEEVSEIEMLWKEMDDAMIESFLQEQTEVEDSSAPTKEETTRTCEHDYRLDEQLGIYCHRCGFVKEEIRYIMPSFAERRSRRHKDRKFNDEEPNPKADDEPNSNDQQNVYEEPKGDENVWGFIPELREKMLPHQKKAFEFLWGNIAGSMKPALMEAQSENSGGCVISHAPGAGKTFLTIAFLVSYLKLFPNKKPLILAPKTTLYTWYQEFIKWKFPMPVYLIHSRRSQRSFSETSLALPGLPNLNGDAKHTLDCLEKIKKWHAHTSVLVMGYTSFLSLINEGSKYEHRRYMAKALREIPGILMLDEGHNPRSTKSNLRKGLMKVKTELRILLSGTLFQNNFGEYFNTLCLARPRFVHEVLQELDPKYVKSEAEKKAPHLVESWARKFFMDKIAMKIDACNENVEEKMLGLNMLKNITSGFIDVYDSTNTDSLLPGLQIYTLLMNNTKKQSEILQTLQKKMNQSGGYPLEVGFLITLVSIHPWLISTTKCAKKFFTSSQLKQLEKCKIDMKIGSKVKFVMSLVFRVVKMKEKVLIFCHNLSPMWLLLELFERYFKWKLGIEILTLHGEQELFEHGKVIDKFEDRRGASKVLLASINACAEGISLTAASRVIFMDSEWNPSKTKQAIARAFRPGQDKVVYVYQLLAAGSFEEDKYKKTNWKDWVSRMIFNDNFVEDPSKWQAQKIEDDVLREMDEADKSKSIHQIIKNEKASTNL